MHCMRRVSVRNGAGRATRSDVPRDQHQWVLSAHRRLTGGAQLFTPQLLCGGPRVAGDGVCRSVTQVLERYPARGSRRFVANAVSFSQRYIAGARLETPSFRPVADAYSDFVLLSRSWVYPCVEPPATIMTRFDHSSFV
jgi:hypothetical protein